MDQSEKVQDEDAAASVNTRLQGLLKAAKEAWADAQLLGAQGITLRDGELEIRVTPRSQKTG